MILCAGDPVSDIEVRKDDCRVLLRGEKEYRKYVPFSAISWVSDDTVLSDQRKKKSRRKAA